MTNNSESPLLVSGMGSLGQALLLGQCDLRLGLAAIGLMILYSKSLGVSANDKTLLKTIHTYFSHVFAINLSWQMAWAFIGNPYARWKALLPYITGVVVGGELKEKSALVSAMLSGKKVFTKPPVDLSDDENNNSK